MHRRTTPQAVIAETIVLVDRQGRIEQSLLVVDADAILQIPEAALYEEAAVGIGTKGEQLAHLALKMETALVNLQHGKTTATADDFARIGRDALTEELRAVTLHLGTIDIIAVEGEPPIGLCLKGEATAHVVTRAVQIPSVKTGEMEGIGSLKHGHGYGFFHNVFGLLGRERKAEEQEYGDKDLTHIILFQINEI